MIAAICSYAVRSAYIQDVTDLLYGADVTDFIRDGCTSMYINAVMENYNGSPKSLRDDEVFRSIQPVAYDKGREPVRTAVINLSGDSTGKYFLA